MWLRAWFMVGWAWSAYSQLHAAPVSVEHLVAGRYSSALLHGYNESSLPNGTVIKWSLVLRHQHSLMVLHTIGSPDLRYSDYYVHRILYNTENGSLTLSNVDLDDRGIYENTVTTHGKTVQKSYYIKILEVLDVLIAPVIIQNPQNAVSIAQLTCVANSWNTDTILWYKGSKLLENDEIYSMSTDNRTLTIKSDQVRNCELYTCVIQNKVSQNKNSHVLILNQLLLLHQYTFVTSIMALVSTSTSFAASVFIIFFALGTYRVHKRHVQLTAVFVLFQLLSFAFLLTASLFCVFDPEHSYFFLVSGALSVVISAAPIYRGHYNIKACYHPLRQASGIAISAVVGYTFSSGLILVLFTKYMKSWTKVRRFSGVSAR